MTELTHAALKTRQRNERAGYADAVSLRIHRALSWLERAEQCKDDDGKFIFLWVAFNAAYAESFEFGQDAELRTQKKLFGQFLGRLVAHDSKHLLAEAVWNEFSNSIRLLLNNEYLFAPFWEQQGDGQGAGVEAQVWRRRFAMQNRAAQKALASGNTVKLLDIVFTRLYLLRNQLIHGGATWNSSVNRPQVEDGARIMQKLIPLIIQLMMDNPDAEWGAPAYPVV